MRVRATLTRVYHGAATALKKIMNAQQGVACELHSYTCPEFGVSFADFMLLARQFGVAYALSTLVRHQRMGPCMERS
jgi:hypothetical protein